MTEIAVIDEPMADIVCYDPEFANTPAGPMAVYRTAAAGQTAYAKLIRIHPETGHFSIASDTTLPGVCPPMIDRADNGPEWVMYGGEPWIYYTIFYLQIPTLLMVNPQTPDLSRMVPAPPNTHRRHCTGTQTPNPYSDTGVLYRRPFPGGNWLYSYRFLSTDIETDLPTDIQPVINFPGWIDNTALITQRAIRAPGGQRNYQIVRFNHNGGLAQLTNWAGINSVGPLAWPSTQIGDRCVYGQWMTNTQLVIRLIVASTTQVNQTWQIIIAPPEAGSHRYFRSWEPFVLPNGDPYISCALTDEDGGESSIWVFDANTGEGFLASPNSPDPYNMDPETLVVGGNVFLYYQHLTPVDGVNPRTMRVRRSQLLITP